MIAFACQDQCSQWDSASQHFVFSPEVAPKHFVFSGVAALLMAMCL